MTIADSLKELKMQMHLQQGSDESEDSISELPGRTSAQAEFLMFGRTASMEAGEMNKLCRQVSIEAPNLVHRDGVVNAIVSVGKCPAKGARILVCYAGACYRKTRETSCTSITSLSDLQREQSDVAMTQATLRQMVGSGSSGQLNQIGNSSSFNCGYRDTSLFPGFEVAGTIESLGHDVDKDCGLAVGQRVILYPYEGCPLGYSEIIVVPDLKYLIPIPDKLDLSVAAMLPTGALLAMSSILSAQKFIDSIQNSRPDEVPVKILIVGTGGLALWAIRIAEEHFYKKESRHKIELSVASLRDEGLDIAKHEYETINVVQWSEDLYEKQLIERTHDACKGQVDIVIDFGTNSRSLQRSLQCLNEGGVVLISEETAEKLRPRFHRRAEERKQHIEPVPMGTIEQLKDLVKLVANRDIEPPPHTVFPAEQAGEVVRKLVQSQIPGRAILQFHNVK